MKRNTETGAHQGQCGYGSIHRREVEIFKDNYFKLN